MKRPFFFLFLKLVWSFVDEFLKAREMQEINQKQVLTFMSLYVLLPLASIE